MRLAIFAFTSSGNVPVRRLIKFHDWPFCFAHYYALLCGRLVVRDTQLENTKLKAGVHDLRVRAA